MKLKRNHESHHGDYPKKIHQVYLPRAIHSDFLFRLADPFVCNGSLKLAKDQKTPRGSK